MRPRALKWFATLACLSLGACGGASTGGTPAAAATGPAEDTGGELAAPAGAVNRSGSGSVSAVLGPAGGSLSLSEGPKVEVPPGALTEAEEFVLKTAPLTTAFLNEEAERPEGPTFVFSPAVSAPEGRAIKVSIPLASYPEGWGEAALGYEYPEGKRVGAEDSMHTRWQYENATLSGGRAVAEVAELTGMRLQFVLTNLTVQ